MIGTRVAFRGAFGPQTGDSVVLAVENKDESNFRSRPLKFSLPKTKLAISAPSAPWSVGESI
jgi:hypothetical protein